MFNVKDNTGCETSANFEVLQAPSIFVSYEVSKPTCNNSDGSATIWVSGGSPPYSYQWPGGSTFRQDRNLHASIYYVSVTDSKGCEHEEAVIVNNLAAPVITIDQVTGVSCDIVDNGAIDVSLSGGSPPVSALWMPDNQTTPDISGITAGSYVLGVNDLDGCAAYESVNVEYEPLAVNPICMVTVDTNTGFNRVVWEQDYTTNVASYDIYRESSKEGDFQKIGSRHVDSSSIFVDTTAHPDMRSWRYRLLVADLCGMAPSVLSDPHKSIHLVSNLSADNSVNLLPEYYEGISTSNYWINRHSPSMDWELAGNFPSSISIYNDNDPPVGEKLRYYIYTEETSGCSPANYTGGTLTNIKSNISIMDSWKCLLTVSIDDQSDVSCYGNTDGFIDISILNNTGPATYNWSNGESTQDISGLTAEKYHVTVTDSVGCVAIDTITILEPEILIASITDSTHVTGPGGSDGQATVTTSGGIQPYSYLWDDTPGTMAATVTGLSANKYYIVIVTDANACTARDSVILSEPGIMSVDIIDSTNISCYGLTDGTAAVTVSGGTPPFSYAWDDDAKSTTATVTGLQGDRWFRVTVTDASIQSDSDSVMLSEPDSISVVKDFTGIVCSASNSGYVHTTVSGGISPYTFLWSNAETTGDIDNLEAGEYSLIITDNNGCLMHDTTMIDPVTTYEDQEICLVTVSRDNKNIVVWEKPPVESIDYFKVYRHTVEFGYLSLAEIPYDSLSIFEDESSVPEEISHFYKISTVDICGNESDLSDFHKTMHLTSNVGTADEVNLIWENYEGFSFVQYDLYRGGTPDDMVKIRSLPNNVTSFTDYNHPAGKLYYQISIVAPSVCTPTSLKKAGAGPYHHALSNLDDNKYSTGIVKGNEIEKLLIYPNPMSETAIVSLDNPNFEKYNLIISDLTGKVHRILDNLNCDKIEIRRDGLPAGIYIIELRGSYVQRGILIVE
jgi:fibronectin type 3 domain-containing protein